MLCIGVCMYALCVHVLYGCVQCAGASVRVCVQVLCGSVLASMCVVSRKFIDDLHNLT